MNLPLSVGFGDKTTWNECGISVAVVNLHSINTSVIGFGDKILGMSVGSVLQW